jgi:hypothetical protein
LSRSERARWLVIAFVAAFDALGLWRCGIALGVSGVARVAAVLLLLGSLAFIYSRWRPNARILDLAHSAAQIITLFAVGGLLSYLVTTTDLPLVDNELAFADRLVGFDWPAWLAWVWGHPALRQLLYLAYFSATPQIVAITIYLALSGQRERNAEFVWTMLLSILAVVIVSACLPAVGALVYYHATDFVWPAHLADFTALREGRLHSLDLMRLEGLITFPSFHTTLGLLFVYVLRGRLGLFVPAALLNAAMILAVPIEGGHYLMDVIAGTAVALAAIWATAHLGQALESRPRPALALAAGE